ncbi:MAG: iron-containing alcohol dehydrogenase, partial [Anaerolineaceae bacterium]|nr:iron-containing alcohol dehydrogenase [Anaerolineaceae bacterium]
MHFEFATTGRIIFGPGSLSEVGAASATLGKRALVVCGMGGANPERLFARLEASGLIFEVYEFHGEPTVYTVRSGTERARQTDCNVVIGYGGGSVLDMAKVIAGLATNSGDVIDYLEGIGQGKSLKTPALPVIAIPTTSGTGAEVTRNAVIASPDHQFKSSLRSTYLLPKVAIVDPELTYSLPSSTTATTGMDALTQLIEPYVSTRANPLTDSFCKLGIPLIARSLKAAYHFPHEEKPREDMSFASLLSGMALANAGLGAVHGFAASIGGIYGAPHGAICARLLAPVCRVNLNGLKKREPYSTCIQRYQHVSVMLTGRVDARAEDGVQWLEALCEEMEIPRLG